MISNASDELSRTRRKFNKATKLDNRFKTELHTSVLWRLSDLPRRQGAQDRALIKLPGSEWC